MPLVDGEEEVIIPAVGGWPSASIPRGEICKIVQPRMEEIFEMVRDQMVKKDYLKHLGGGVVLTGGGALMPGAAELAKEVFGIPARIGYPAKMGGVADVYQSPVYSTGVGLVLYAAEKAGEELQRSAPLKASGGGVMEKFRSWLKEFF
jgi:cell division protein FtsA